jgi:Stage II sporulation protein E (SpoIIE)
MSLTELIGIAIGCMLVALGFGSIAAWLLRRRAAERLLLLFGIWCLLYGLRLVALQTPVHLSIGGSHRTWAYIIAFVTYVINVPGGLFFEALLGPGWKYSIRRVWQLQAVYAAVAISTDLILGRPNAAMGPNRPIVLAGLAVQALNVWFYRRRLNELFTTPMIAAGGFVLLFFVVNENLGRPFVPAAVDLEPVGVLLFVTTLAYGVVGSVFRGEAELLAVQRELKTARQIQLSLLPREPPRVRGLDVAVRYVPMTAVAGDLYDFVALGPSRMGILVADVCGHGIPAALIASMVKLAFSTQADHAHDPGRVLTMMNRVLTRQLEHGFVTAVYAVVDTDRGTITAANAGHPPLLIGRSNGSVEGIDERGLMLGFESGASYTNSEIDLRDGDLVLLYTDGVTEARNPAGEFFDDERVRRWLTAADGRDASRFTDGAFCDLRDWRGHPAFEDDVTFVVARFAATA